MFESVIKEELERVEMNTLLIDKLFLQFKAATGAKSATYKEVKSEFINWITTMCLIKDKYADLVSQMDIDRDKVVAELGKGYYDSIVPNLQERDLDAIALTPYGNTFKNGVKAFDGKLVKNGKAPYILYPTNQEQFILPNCNPTYNTNIGTIIIQFPINSINPEKLYTLISLAALVESSRHYNDVIIGSYGNTNDKNMSKNIETLRVIRERIEDMYCMSCEEELVEENGTYQHLIMSQQKTLRRELIPTR